jgi:integrase
MRLRIGEQAALRTPDILFGHGEIFVRHGAFEPKSGRVQIGPLKTRYSRGRVDVPQFLLDELGAHLKTYPPAGEGASKGLVFPSPDGDPLRPRNWRRRYWDRAVEEAGIEPATPHAMRHTFVSFLIDQRLPVEKVAEQARHRDTGFTWRVYRHPFERRDSEGFSDAALALQNVWTTGLSRGRSGGPRGDGRPLRAVPSTSAAGPSGL